MLVLGASAAMAVGPEIAVRVGEPAPAADGLTIGSTTDGSDALECLREGEWSVGQVKVKPKLYQDMGEAPDIATVKPPPVEFNRLNAWISNPNAPRVSGTVSAPTLRLSEGDLARDGEAVNGKTEQLHDAFLTVGDAAVAE